MCDRYLEAVKPTVDDDPNQQVVLGSVLDAVLRLMHPVCPFVTEALWAHVSAARTGHVVGLSLPPSTLLAAAAWPRVDDALANVAIVADFDRADALAAQIRVLRAERQVKPRQLLTLHAPAPVAELIATAAGVVEALAGVGDVVDIAAGRPAVASPIAFEGSEVLVSGLVDAVDLDVERARLAKVIEQKSGQIAGFEAKLANEGYVANAKPELVQQTRDLLGSARADLHAAEAAMEALR